MHEGRVTQFGPTAETYRKPHSLVTARVFSDPPINTAAVVKRGIPSKLYMPAFSRRTFETIQTALTDLGVDLPMPELDDDALEAAIRQGRDRLQNVTGRRLALVSYPHGK